LSADQRVVNNETILTASRIFNARDGWDGHTLIFEVSAKFPNGHCFKSWVWLDFIGGDYIDFVGFEEFNPNLIRSGLNFGKQLKFSGFSSIIDHDFTNVFNVFTMEWTKDYIYWKLNGKQYHKESINRYIEFENGRYYYKIREPFDRKYLITFEVRCDPINDRRVDKDRWTNPYLFIDYIKVYKSYDSETDEIIQNKTGIAKNVSQDNDSAIIKYVMTGFLVLFLMLIVFFCFVLYFINKRTSITKSIISAKNNDYGVPKRDDFRESFDVFDNNNEQNDYYEIVESQEVEDSQNLNNTYLEII
jgi:hypothetical protein